MDIKNIQKDLKKNKINGSIYTLNNLFLEEDILEEENQILKLTGFTGSYAILFITPSKSYLFIDGRYELQAKKEVNSRQIELVKLSEISFFEWLKKNYSKTTATISYNPWLTSAETLQHLQKLLPKTTFIHQFDLNKNLSSNKVKTFAHHKKFAPISTKNKLENITKYIKKQKLDAYLITSAANVSWLLNLRSNALPYTPILRAYALVDKAGGFQIFAEYTDIKQSQPFSSIADFLSKYQNIGADFCTTPSYIPQNNKNIKNIPDIITKLKSIKNSSELKEIVNAHIRDGVALSKFLFWLSKNYKGKTEIEIAEKLLSYRKKELNFYSESFPTIAGFGVNSAIVHYHASNKKASTLKKGSVLLLDSGAQYYDGTTDITRTIALGKPTADMIEKNTYVLKAHIALASAIFPKKTTGSELDLIARQPLLKKGLNFEHGTGHGVGLFSNVHEGPARISINAKNSAPLEAGMITSIEPGYYKENSYGIRIENLYYIKSNPKTNYLNFEVLTLVPLDKTLINKYLLTEDEQTWVNSYHKEVFHKIKKYLTKQELEWLKEACSPL